MNPLFYVCTNKNCELFSQKDKNNLVIHSQKEQRLKCSSCGKTFSIRKGTGFYRLRYWEQEIICMLTLLLYGCPSVAIEKAFGVDSRTLENWVERFGQSSRKMHKNWLDQLLRNVRIQADELYLKLCKGKAWIATALCVESRLWLGLVVERRRTNLMIKRLLTQVYYCVVKNTGIYFETDGLSSYASQIANVFRQKVPGKTRWKWQTWPKVVLVQIIKTYQKKGKGWKFTGLSKVKLSLGIWPQVKDYVAKFGIRYVNTAYIERLNATLRGQIACLVRRNRSLKKQIKPIEHLCWLKLTVYNFVTYHRSLYNKEQKKSYTPAMKAGSVDKKYEISDILHFNTFANNISHFHIHG